MKTYYPLGLFMICIIIGHTFEHPTTKFKTIQTPQDSTNIPLLLNPIKANFKRINSIKKWAKIDSVLLENTTENGQINYYYQDQKLQKIIVANYGETFQNIAEYYLLDNKISFVFNKLYRYNKPMSEIDFDIEDSDITENRLYFHEDKLIVRINSKEGTSSYINKNLTAHQNKTINEFKTLLKKQR